MHVLRVLSLLFNNNFEDVVSYGTADSGNY